MKTYLLFGFDTYYPGGGMDDCRGVFSANNDDEAIAKAVELIKVQTRYFIYQLGRLEGDSLTEVDCNLREIFDASGAAK